MTHFISFLVEANLGICFFLLVYKILLSKETDHRFNRAFLLFALAISIVLPFLHFRIPSVLTVGEGLQTYLLPEIQVTSLRGLLIQFDSFWFWTTSVYLIGAAISFMVFLIRLFNIAKEVFRAAMVKHESAWVIELNGEGEVFSFFKFIFVSKSLRLSDLEKQQVIRHERVHINNYHSCDILLINLISVLFWFNPFLKTYREVFVQVHEFEADARSVESHEVEAYCGLLAKAALQSSGFQLANHFTNSLTIKRIEMMKTVKTKISRRKVISIFGASIAFCCLVAGNSSVLGQAEQKNTSSNDEVFEQVDQLPTYGNEAQFAELYEFIGKNLAYPEEARKSKIEGKVFAKFVVEKDGSLSNVKVLKGIGHGCDEEVVRVVKLLPAKWKPGEKNGKIVRTTYTLPFFFKLSEQKKGD